MSRFKKTGLYLTGGLGNQLFQFAAALSYSQSGKIELFEKFGKPRLNSKGEPEIFSLTVEEIASVSRRAEDNLLLRKSSGYLLRSRIWPRKLEKFIIIQLLTDLAASVIQTFNFRDFFYPISISDVGYRRINMNRFVRRIFNPMLIGYFQTSVWPQEIKAKLQLLKLKQEGPEILKLRVEASVKRPVVIHIRRGDYKSESTFGLLGENYYEDAMSIINRQYPTNPVWVFSDEESEARKILGCVPADRVRYISDVDGESAASLMAMRLGCAYVIANSTFSWWGAFLSECEEPLVVAPKPWFVGQQEPTLLIPPNWYRVDH